MSKKTPKPATKRTTPPQYGTVGRARKHRVYERDCMPPKIAENTSGMKPPEFWK